MKKRNKLGLGVTYVCDSSDLAVTVLSNPYKNKFKLGIGYKNNPYVYIETKYYKLDMERIGHWKILKK